QVWRSPRRGVGIRLLHWAHRVLPQRVRLWNSHATIVGRALSARYRTLRGAFAAWLDYVRRNLVSRRPPRSALFRGLWFSHFLYFGFFQFPLARRAYLPIRRALWDLSVLHGICARRFPPVGGRPFPAASLQHRAHSGRIGIRVLEGATQKFTGV